jgi:hypothetical protein
MSELQLGLLVIGAAVVAAVLGYNKWQESRYRREAEASLSPHGEDVLLRTAGPASRVEPTLDPEPASPATIAPVVPTLPSAAVLSEAIDCIIELQCAEPVEGHDVVAASVRALANIAKAVNIEGAVGDGWEALRREGSYRRVRVGMQLVDRRGPVRPQDLAGFESAVADMGASVGATALPADLEGAARTAATLDRFSGEVDVQIAVHIVKAGEPLTGGAISDMAHAAGLALDHDGRFRRRDGEGRELYSLVNEEAAPFHAASLTTLRTSAILAELDVPRAAGGAATFAPFRDFCLQAASALGATLVDDNRTALGKPSFDAIAAQLQPVYENMKAHGIAAGSPLALRLFS